MTSREPPAAHAAGGLAGETLSVEDIRRRSITGARVLALRGALLKVLGAAGILVTVRYLDPEDFGLVALGVAVVSFGHLLVEGGLAASLVRSPTEPTLQELASVRAFQVALGGGLAAVVLSLAVPFGEAWLVTGLIAVSVPVTALRTPAAVMLERDLRYRPVATAELIGQTTNVVIGVGLAAAGAGPYALVAGILAREASATAYLTRNAPRGLAWARPDRRLLMPHLRFGLPMQMTSLAGVARDQGANLLTAAVAGTTVLGLVYLARSLVLVPLRLVQGFYRVGFAAMSRLLAQGHPLDSAARSTAMSTLLPMTVVCTGLAAAGPGLLPGLFGPDWVPAGEALVWAFLSAVLLAPIGVVASGVLQANGRSSRVTTGIAVGAGLSLPGIVLLAPGRGAEGVTLSLLLGAVVEALLLLAFLRPYLRQRTLRAILVPTVVAGAGLLAADQLADMLRPSSAVVVLGGAALSSVGSAALVVASSPGLALDSLRSMASGLPGGRRAPVSGT